MSGTRALDLPPALDDPRANRRQVRLVVAAHDYPSTLMLSGAILVLFTVLTFVSDPVRNGQLHNVSIHVIDLTVAAMMVGTGLLLRRDTVPLAGRPWVFAGAATLLTLALLYQETITSDALAYSYAVLVLCAFGPATLAWRPFLASSIVNLAGCLVITVGWPMGPTLDWFLVGLAATLISAILLSVRLRSVDAFADATAQVQRMAMTDQLTGRLNRHGLSEHAAVLWATSQRLDAGVFVVFVDIEGLKLANDRHGHEFGDQVIRAAARATSAAARPGDLVARWGGDELVVVGMGDRSETEAFAERLARGSEWTGSDRERWDGSLSVGFAHASAAEVTLEALISQADDDMYRRRRHREVRPPQ